MEVQLLVIAWYFAHYWLMILLMNKRIKNQTQKPLASNAWIIQLDEHYSYHNYCNPKKMKEISSNKNKLPM